MIKKILNRKLYSYFLNQKRCHTTRYELPIFDRTKCIPLTDSEKESINNVRKVLNTSATYEYWLMYKNFVGFNAEFIADDDFMPQIIRVLNPNPYYKTMQHKGLYPILFKGLRKPYTIINCINNVWYNNEGETITQTKDNLKEIFKNVDSFIIKSTKGTCGGKGVAKVDYLNPEQIKSLFFEYGTDFICQEVVKQSKQTKQFNPTSLNTFRISTININGNCTLGTIMFRHGREGQVVDNAGAGGIYCGIDATGKTIKAFDRFLKEYSVSENGIDYSNFFFQNIENLVEEAMNAHKQYLPNMGFAGWDFCLDENNNPIFIEVNLGYPSILYEQLCSVSPIFGNRTNEVYEYVGSNMHKLSWKTDFIGSAL